MTQESLHKGESISHTGSLSPLLFQTLY